EDQVEERIDEQPSENQSKRDQCPEFEVSQFVITHGRPPPTCVASVVTTSRHHQSNDAAALFWRALAPNRLGIDNCTCIRQRRNALIMAAYCNCRWKYSPELCLRQLRGQGNDCDAKQLTLREVVPPRVPEAACRRRDGCTNG